MVKKDTIKTKKVYLPNSCRVLTEDCMTKDVASKRQVLRNSLKHLSDTTNYKARKHEVVPCKVVLEKINISELPSVENAEKVVNKSSLNSLPGKGNCLPLIRSAVSPCQVVLKKVKNLSPHHIQNSEEELVSSPRQNRSEEAQEAFLSFLQLMKINSDKFIPPRITKTEYRGKFYLEDKMKVNRGKQYKWIKVKRRNKENKGSTALRDKRTKRLEVNKKLMEKWKMEDEEWLLPKYRPTWKKRLEKDKECTTLKSKLKANNNENALKTLRNETKRNVNEKQMPLKSETRMRNEENKDLNQFGKCKSERRNVGDRNWTPLKSVKKIRVENKKQILLKHKIKINKKGSETDKDWTPLKHQIKRLTQDENKLTLKYMKTRRKEMYNKGTSLKYKSQLWKEGNEKLYRNKINELTPVKDKMNIEERDKTGKLLKDEDETDKLLKGNDTNRNTLKEHDNKRKLLKEKDKDLSQFKHNLERRKLEGKKCMTLKSVKKMEVENNDTLLKHRMKSNEKDKDWTPSKSVMRSLSEDKKKWTLTYKSKRGKMVYKKCTPLKDILRLRREAKTSRRQREDKELDIIKQKEEKNNLTPVNGKLKVQENQKGKLMKDEDKKGSLSRKKDIKLNILKEQDKKQKLLKEEDRKWILFEKEDKRGKLLKKNEKYKLLRNKKRELLTKVYKKQKLLKCSMGKNKEDADWMPLNYYYRHQIKKCEEKNLRSSKYKKTGKDVEKVFTPPENKQIKLSCGMKNETSLLAMDAKSKKNVKSQNSGVSVKQCKVSLQKLPADKLSPSNNSNEQASNSGLNKLTPAKKSKQSSCVYLSPCGVLLRKEPVTRVVGTESPEVPPSPYRSALKNHMSETRKQYSPVSSFMNSGGNDLSRGLQWSQPLSSVAYFVETECEDKKLLRTRGSKRNVCRILNFDDEESDEDVKHEMSKRRKTQ